MKNTAKIVIIVLSIICFLAKPHKVFAELQMSTGQTCLILTGIGFYLLEPLIPDLRYEHAWSIRGSDDSIVHDSLVLSWPLHYWVSTDRRFSRYEGHDWSLFMEPQWSVQKKAFRILAGTRHNFYFGSNHSLLFLVEAGPLYGTPDNEYGGFLGIGFGPMFDVSFGSALVVRGYVTDREVRIDVSIDIFPARYFTIF